MLFHVIGIKEIQDRKYNLDIVVDGESDNFIRKFLQNYNIIVLNISPYTKQSSDFGILQIAVSYKNGLVYFYSYISDIKKALSLFMTIGFDIKYANFINKNRLSNSDVEQIILDAKKKIKLQELQYKKDIDQKKEQERQIYKDQKLEKTRKIIDQTFIQIEELLQKVGHRVSETKIRQLQNMQQDLTKLKMGRNEDKMLELLQKVYEKIDDIDMEYLAYMQKNIDYPIENSVVTNIDIISENQKYKKAKKIKELGSKKSLTDVYYLFFDSFGIYLKLMYKDLKNFLKFLPIFIKNIFFYANIFFLLLIIIISLLLLIDKISYKSDINLYYYVLLIKASIFGIILYFVQFIKKTTILSNILYLVISVLISFAVYYLSKINFVF